MLCIFSIIEISILLRLCPGRLKCAPVILFVCLFFTYPRRSENLAWSVLFVSPTYWVGHFLQLIKKMRFRVWQFTLVLISKLNLLWADLRICPGFTNGQNYYIFSCHSHFSSVLRAVGQGLLLLLDGLLCLWVFYRPPREGGGILQLSLGLVSLSSNVSPQFW